MRILHLLSGPVFLCSSLHAPLVAKAQERTGGGPQYGRLCGIAGAPPKLRYEIEDIIAAGDTAAMFSWLNDRSMVKQAYGAEAVIRAERAGMALPAWSVTKAHELRRSPLPVNSCRGCLMGEMPLNETMRECLKQAKRDSARRRNHGNSRAF